MAYDQEEMKQLQQRVGKGTPRFRSMNTWAKRHSLSPSLLMGVNPNIKRLLRNLDDSGIDALILKHTDSEDSGSPALLMIQGRVHLDRFC